MAHLICDRHKRRAFVENGAIYHRSSDMPVRCMYESGKPARKVRIGDREMDSQEDFKCA